MKAATDPTTKTFAALLKYWRADPTRPYPFAADRADPEARAIGELRELGVVDVLYIGHEGPQCLPREGLYPGAFAVNLPEVLA